MSRSDPRIAILGTVEVTGTGRTTPLPGTHLPALLSMLALDPGRPVSNSRMARALWPSASPERAQRSLTSLVHQLNAVLGAHLGARKAVSSMKSVGRVLRIDPSTIDIVQFDHLLAAADDRVAGGRLDEAVDGYEAALALWRGDPFGGLDLPEFLESSARLRIARHRAETALIETSLRIGRGAALVPWLLQRVEAGPADEAVATDAARALYQAGRSGDALSVLRICMEEGRRRGTAPSAEIRQLELDVLEHALDGPDDTVTPVPLIAPVHSALADLIGRRAERTALEAWLATASGPTVMSVVGEAGIGKTALLHAWVEGRAHRSVLRCACGDADHPVDPFADLLAEPDSADLDQATDRCADVASHQRFERAVRRIVGSGVRMIVVDDAQWIGLGAVALLRHLLSHPEVSRLHVVVIVRTPEGDRNTDLNRLLGDLARAGRAGRLELGPFDLDDLDELVSRHRESSEPIDIDWLMQLTGGNPMLATEVMLGLEHGRIELDHPLPPEVARVLGRHLVGVTPAARRILGFAAALGSQGSPAQLARSASVSELEAIEALDEVAAGRLVHVEPVGGAYRFVHELARLVAMVRSDAHALG